MAAFVATVTCAMALAIEVNGNVHPLLELMRNSPTPNPWPIVKTKKDVYLWSIFDAQNYLGRFSCIISRYVSLGESKETAKRSLIFPAKDKLSGSSITTWIQVIREDKFAELNVTAEVETGLDILGAEPTKVNLIFPVLHADGKCIIMLLPLKRRIDSNKIPCIVWVRDDALTRLPHKCEKFYQEHCQADRVLTDTTSCKQTENLKKET